MSDKHYEQAFFTVPNRILNLPGLTIAFLRFYETIFHFWHKEQLCFLSNDALKERTGISSSSTIQEAFVYFEKHGEIKRVQKGRRRFIIQPERKISFEDISDQKSSKVSVNRESTSRPTETLPLGTARHNNNNINNINIIKDKNYCASDDALKSFEEFWSIYPRKKDKKRAFETWLKCGCHEKAKIIIDKVSAQILNEAQWKNAQYIPHATTYLRNARWEDEITLPKIVQKKESGGERALRLFRQGRASHDFI
jgi:hypothetical protein